MFKKVTIELSFEHAELLHEFLVFETLDCGTDKYEKMKTVVSDQIQLYSDINDEKDNDFLRGEKWGDKGYEGKIDDDEEEGDDEGEEWKKGL